MSKIKSLKLLSVTFLSVLIIPSANIVFAQIPTVFSPGIVSGPAHDSALAFMPDGKTVYFSRSNASGGTILVSHLKNGKWSNPQIASFSGKWADLEPAMSPDGSFLVFISSRPADGKGKQLDGFYNGQPNPGNGGNLWRVNLVRGKSSEPVRLPDNVNRSGNIYAPSVVRDGSVYFMDASGEKQRFKLFRSQFNDGVYANKQAAKNHFPSEMLEYFKGDWSGEGKFAASGKNVTSDFSFIADAENQTLLVREKERAPNKYHFIALWSFDSTAGNLVMLFANDSGAELFRSESASWLNDKIIFQSAPELKAAFAFERFTFERKSDNSFLATYEMSRDGKIWRTGDTQTFTRK